MSPERTTPAAAAASFATGEDEFVQRWFAPMAAPAALGLRDDAATFAVRPGDEVVVTADAIVAGVHFLPDDPPAAIAQKALRVNLSDLAAKGATPLCFVLTLALPGRPTAAFFAPFAQALAADASRFACPLLGGDTVATPGPLTISITAFGTLPAGTMVRRAGARIGDLVAVTGTIGDAALGLDLRLGRWHPAGLATAERGRLLSRYQVPEPRTALAEAVRNYAHAAMDVSDGLAGDLAKLCAVSGVGARIRADAVPLSIVLPTVGPERLRLLKRMLAGGDDYELLLVLPRDGLEQLSAAAARAGIALTVIGEIVPGADGVTFRDGAGHPLAIPLAGYSHFGE